MEQKIEEVQKTEDCLEKLNYYLEALGPYQVSSTLTNIHVKSSFIFIDWKKKIEHVDVGDMSALRVI